MVSGKSKRLAALLEVPLMAAIDHRYMQDEDGNHQLLSGLNRKERRKIQADGKKIGGEYKRVLIRNQNSGAGFPVDVLLRDLTIEYTHRYASSGLNNQPLSFNYFEPFCNILLIKNSTAPYAEPIEEIDHLFNLTDYFDYITSGSSDGFDPSSLMELPEAKALHFTTNGDIFDFTLLNPEGREFVISGITMVRRGSSLYWYLLGGEIFSDVAWKLMSEENEKIDIKNIEPHKRPFLSEIMAENNYSLGRPIALQGTDNALRTIVAGEFGLVTKRYLGKCLMTEYEHSFSIATDDPEIFSHRARTGEVERTILQNMKSTISRAGVMWDLVGSMFQLPSYFAYKIEVSKNIIVTEGKRLPRMTTKGGKGLRNNYKMVSAIDIVDSNAPIIREIIPSFYQSETEGHWKKLPHGSIGEGVHGNKEVNRTWVKASNPWRNEISIPKNIYVKSTVKAAKARIDEYKITYEQDKTQQIENHESSELYVMRCPLMEEGVFKVGWTSIGSKARAEQLSSATGVPKSFIIVDSWKHKNAELLEKNVHAMLEPYRVNTHREFFKAPYKSIKRIIEQEIQQQYSDE